LSPSDTTAANGECLGSMELRARVFAAPLGSLETRTPCSVRLREPESNSGVVHARISFQRPSGLPTQRRAGLECETATLVALSRSFRFGRAVFSRRRLPCQLLFRCRRTFVRAARFRAG